MGKIFLGGSIGSKRYIPLSPKLYYRQRIPCFGPELGQNFYVLHHEEGSFHLYVIPCPKPNHSLM